MGKKITVTPALTAKRTALKTSLRNESISGKDSDLPVADRKNRTNIAERLDSITPGPPGSPGTEVWIAVAGLSEGLIVDAEYDGDEMMIIGPGRGREWVAVLVPNAPTLGDAVYWFHWRDLAIAPRPKPQGNGPQGAGQGQGGAQAEAPGQARAAQPGGPT